MFSHAIFSKFLISDGKKINPNIRKLILKHNQTDNINGLIKQYGFSTDINSISTVDLVQVLWQDFNKTARPGCRVCGSPAKFKGWQPGWNSYCSSSCQMRDPKQQSLRKEDALNRFGVGNYLLKGAIKARATRSTVEYKTRFRNAVMKSFQDPVKKAIRIDRMNKSRAQSDSRPWIAQHKKKLSRLIDLQFEIIDSTASGKPKTIKHSCGAIQGYGRWSSPDSYLCSACYPNTRIKAETNFLNDLEAALGLSIARNIKHGPYKFDGQIGNLVIEYNGMFWHSAAAGAAGLGDVICPNYHRDKFAYCETVGLRLIQIFEDEVQQSLDVVIARIKNALGQLRRVAARQCSIVQLLPNAARDFLRKYHSNRSVPCSLAFALLHEGEPVAVATVGKSRFGRREGYELLRFATAGISVVGGLSRLLIHITSTLDSDIITYSDNLWGNGSGYRAAGAVLEQIVKPGYFYFDKKNFTRVSRQAMQKHNFEKMFGSKWDLSLSEEENAAAVNCYRIYDAGKSRWMFKKRNEKF